MSFNDQLYISVYIHFRNIKIRFASKLARLYLSLLQIGVFFAFTLFIIEFLKQMKINFLNTNHAFFFVSVSIFICFRNWLIYNGKRHKILMAKKIELRKHYSILSLILFQILTHLVSFIFYKVI